MMPAPSVLAGFREQRRFQAWARELVRLPQAGEGPLDYLVPEARWQELLGRAPDPAGWLMAVSAATGVYFFPSREWPPLLVRYLRRLGVRRLLEAGAGRGYLTAALAPLASSAGMAFLAVDRGEGEYVAELPVHPLVQRGDAFDLVKDFRADAVLFAWPPPGQSVARFFDAPAVRYVIVAGEAGGGATGAREDWQNLPHKVSGVLGRCCRGRTGSGGHGVAVFYGGGGQGSTTPALPSITT